jgi:hypothetical protein
MLFRDIIVVYCDKHEGRVNMPCGLNAELFVAKASSILRLDRRFWLPHVRQHMTHCPHLRYISYAGNWPARNKLRTHLVLRILLTAFRKNALYSHHLLKKTIYVSIIRFIIKSICILPTQRITGFRKVLTINSDCFPKQH